MGLDMFLYREKYLSKDDNKIEITNTKTNEKKEYKPYDTAYSVVIKDQVAYWRKANQIHKWFVDNVQNGEDDCGYHYVSREQLEQLLELCKEVKASCKLVKGKVANGYHLDGDTKVYDYEDGEIIEDPSVAQELLPTQAGFFFGGTDYDEHYLEDIDLTIEQLEKILDDDYNADVDFYYTSSW